MAPSFAWQVVAGKPPRLVKTDGQPTEKGAKGKSKGKGKGKGSLGFPLDASSIPCIEFPEVYPKTFVSCLNKSCLKGRVHYGKSTPSLCKFCGTPFVFMEVPPLPSETNLRPPYQPKSNEPKTRSKVKSASADHTAIAKFVEALKVKGVAMEQVNQVCSEQGIELPIPPKESTLSTWDQYQKLKRKISHLELLISHQENQLISLAAQAEEAEEKINSLSADRVQAISESHSLLAQHEIELAQCDKGNSAVSVQREHAHAQAKIVSSQLQLLSQAKPKSEGELAEFLLHLTSLASDLDDTLNAVDAEISIADDIKEVGQNPATVAPSISDEHPQTTPEEHVAVFPEAGHENMLPTVQAHPLALQNQCEALGTNDDIGAPSIEISSPSVDDARMSLCKVLSKFSESPLKKSRLINDGVVADPSLADADADDI